MTRPPIVIYEPPLIPKGRPPLPFETLAEQPVPKKRHKRKRDQSLRILRMLGMGQ